MTSKRIIIASSFFMVMVVLAVIALAGLYVGNKRLQVESFKNEKIGAVQFFRG